MGCTAGHVQEDCGHELCCSQSPQRWFCDGCRQSSVINPARLRERWRCTQGCNYDLCAECRQRRKALLDSAGCFGGDAPKLTVSSPSMQRAVSCGHDFAVLNNAGNWFCDSCKKNSYTNAKRLQVRYRCAAGCKVDLCQACHGAMQLERLRGCLAPTPEPQYAADEIAAMRQAVKLQVTMEQTSLLSDVAVQSADAPPKRPSSRGPPAAAALAADLGAPSPATLGEPQWTADQIAEMRRSDHQRKLQVKEAAAIWEEPDASSKRRPSAPGPRPMDRWQELGDTNPHRRASEPGALQLQAIDLFDVPEEPRAQVSALPGRSWPFQSIASSGEVSALPGRSWPLQSIASSEEAAGLGAPLHAMAEGSMPTGSTPPGSTRRSTRRSIPSPSDVAEAGAIGEPVDAPALRRSMTEPPEAAALDGSAPDAPHRSNSESTRKKKKKKTKSRLEAPEAEQEASGLVQSIPDGLAEDGGSGSDSSGTSKKAKRKKDKDSAPLLPERPSVVAVKARVSRTSAKATTAIQSAIHDPMDTVSERGHADHPALAPVQPPSTDKKVCPHGEACYRKNPLHFEEYAHPWLDSAPRPSQRQSLA